MVAGGVDTGWTFYPPYSTHSPTAVGTVALGVFILGISTIMTGINFIVTTHTLRAKGLSWGRLPLFVWAIYGTSIIQVLATPVLGLTLALVALDHVFRVGIFDPAAGGDPLLYQHLFWFYSHPAVYIMILPAMGVISEVVSTFSHKNPFSYRGIVIATVGIAFVGFLTWGHHMFVAGMSTLDAGIFGILSMFVAVFSAIKVFSWIGTLYGGSISFRTPMLYFFEFLFLFGVGGMTGVALASMSLDVHWHDTYFVVAHFHFIMVGGTLTGFLAALHYWFPKMFGRLYPERLGYVAAVLVFIGFLGTFVPQFLLGNAGMPRRYYDYPARFQTLQRALDDGIVVARRRSHPGARISPVVAALGRADVRQPVGIARLRVGHAVAAAARQLPRAAGDHAQAPRLLRGAPMSRASSAAAGEGAGAAARLHLTTRYETLENQTQAARLGMWVFLASEVLLFGGLFTLYAGTRAQYPREFAAAAGETDLLLGSLNTYILVTASFLVALALHATRASRPRAAGVLLRSPPASAWRSSA